MIMRNVRSKGVIGVESLEGRELQSTLNPQPLPPRAPAPAEIRTALNLQPLPPGNVTDIRHPL
jgi:hypothetical protein